VEDNTYFRLRVVTFDNVPWVATMKKCEHYFPTVEFVKDGREQGCGWVRRRWGEDGGVGGLAGEAAGLDEDGGRGDEGGGEM